MASKLFDPSTLIPQRKLADMLGVSIETLCRWGRKGCNGKILEKVKLGRRVYYEPAAVEAFRAPSGEASQPPAA